MPRHRQVLGGARASACIVAVLSVGAAAAGQLACAADLSPDEHFRFALGQAVFRKQWVSAPASATSSDGLGPLYNARACAQCHPQAGRGQPEPDRARDLPASLVVRLAVPPLTAGERELLSERKASVLPEPTYGLQLQPFALQGHRSEGRLEVSYHQVRVVLSDGEVVGLRRPFYRAADLGYGPMRQDATVSPRVAPPLVGLGLIEMVPEAQMLEREGGAGAGGAIRGTASRVWSKKHGKVVLGRFGWRAEVPTLRQQVAEAFAIDLGLSSTLVEKPAGDCTARQPQCLQAPDGRGASRGGQEIDDALLDLVTHYVANANLPVRKPVLQDAPHPGEALFHAVGCAACHRPSFVTGTTSGPAHLRGVVIRPYSDLLLHDMGEGLADERSDGQANGRMWRTAPLWAVGRAQTPDGRQTFLHDGRARSLDEAVLWHGGEASEAREAFARLTAAERHALVAFLKSL